MNVTLQIAPSRERNLAKATLVRRIVSVNVHVKLQIRQFVEGLVAQSTLVRFFYCVDENMISQIALLVKTFPTAFANKFLLKAVGSHVCFQSG